ncbi:glycosyltransferase family protein [Winogradskyella aurantiaca]|uniref:hypothetical protein n=1 Tax=Winogradskyella aurantiaca TaxID=2219558 RepID=UPI000E1C83E4|nr:hypothetical protein [Winogradskyella aurantiaca]
MKIGIIMIFQNNEKNIDWKFFLQHLEKSKPIKFCLVNNGSTDDTGLLLVEITEGCTNVSSVHIKRLKKEKLAIRAGVRYLWNEYGIECIGFVNTNDFRNSRDFESLMKDLVSKANHLLSYKSNTHENYQYKRPILQSLFPLKAYLDSSSLDI